MAALSVVSCKDKDEEVLPSLEGRLQITGNETFIGSDKESRTLSLKPTGAKHPKGKKLGYYWKVSPVMSSYDTTRYENGLNKKGQTSDGTFTYELPDSLGTYTIYCYAYASGHTGLSAAAYTTIVKGGVQTSDDDTSVSITNTDIAINGTQINGTEYYYVTNGNLDWTANNMAEKGKGTAFLGLDIMSDVFGRYYSYQEAKEICEGLASDNGNEWRLPTDADWIDLVNSITADAQDFTANVHQDISWDNKKNGTPSLGARLLADAYFNGDKLWEFWPEMGVPQNTSGMAILPTGYANLGVTPEVSSRSSYPGALFSAIYEFAAFWTADEVSDDTNQAYYRYIYTKKPDLMIGKGDKVSFGASVRCVRNSN